MEAKFPSGVSGLSLDRVSLIIAYLSTLATNMEDPTSLDELEGMETIHEAYEELKNSLPFQRHEECDLTIRRSLALLLFTTHQIISFAHTTGRSLDITHGFLIDAARDIFECQKQRSSVSIDAEKRTKEPATVRWRQCRQENFLATSTCPHRDGQ